MAQQVQREGLQVLYRSQAASVSDVRKRGERRSKRLDERWYLAGRNPLVWWVVGGEAKDGVFCVVRPVELTAFGM